MQAPRNKSRRCEFPFSKPGSHRSCLYYGKSTSAFTITSLGNDSRLWKVSPRHTYYPFIEEIANVYSLAYYHFSRRGLSAYGLLTKTKPKQKRSTNICYRPRKPFTKWFHYSICMPPILFKSAVNGLFNNLTGDSCLYSLTIPAILAAKHPWCRIPLIRTWLRCLVSILALSPWLQRNWQWIADKFYNMTEPFLKSIFQNTGEDEFPFDLSPEELDIVSHFNTSSLILGRSGTGKTTCLLFKILAKYRAQSFSDEAPVRQVFWPSQEDTLTISNHDNRFSSPALHIWPQSCKPTQKAWSKPKFKFKTNVRLPWLMTILIPWVKKYLGSRCRYFLWKIKTFRWSARMIAFWDFSIAQSSECLIFRYGAKLTSIVKECWS